MIDPIVVDSVFKSYRFTSVHKPPTIKDFVIRSMRREGGASFVDALSDVSFTVPAGSMLGVIGRNGSGKTTLMRVLAGVLQPDKGNVVITGSMAPLLALGAGFHPDLTGREGARIELLSLGLSRREVSALMDDIIAFSEIGEFADAPVRTYSIGMVMRLAFSVAICVDPDVLLLDEVLAVGDEGFAHKCLASIAEFRRRGKTIVLVTHNADIVESWCDAALWLDRGKIASIGDPKDVVSGYHQMQLQQH